MPWNGSGVFNRVYSWVADKNAGLDIIASRMDTDTDDITSAGLGNCVTRDGQGQPNASIIPLVSASYDLGSNAFQWRNAWFSGTVNAGNGAFAGLTATNPVLNGTATGTAFANSGTDTIVGAKSGALSISAGGSQSITTPIGTTGLIIFTEQSGVGSSGNSILYSNNNNFVGVGALTQAISSGITKITSVVGDAGGTGHVTINVGSGGGTITGNYKMIPFNN